MTLIISQKLAIPWALSQAVASNLHIVFGVTLSLLEGRLGNVCRNYVPSSAQNEILPRVSLLTLSSAIKSITFSVSPRLKLL
jgi:hypothetical protein